jgi:ABC-type Na+ efflux pump permease subunit
VDPRKLLRIARWEVTKNAGGVDRRTLLVAVGAIVLLVAVGPVVAGGSVGLDDGIYRVGVDEDSPYYPVAATDDTFAVRPEATEATLERGGVELLIREGRIVAREDDKGLAALEEFRASIDRFDRDRLAAADNQTAAFPVRVALRYRTQANVQPNYGATEGDGSTDADGSTGSTGDGGDGDNATAGNGSGGDGGGTSGESGGAVSPDEVSGGLGGFGARFGSQDTVVNSPSSLSPPFPFQSLVLAFVFVIPLNFLIQAYGSTILSERLNRRGELLLVSPVTRTDIIAGKTLPYFLGALAVEAVIAVGLSLLATGAPGGLISVLAVAPLVLLFLAATFLGAMFARSFKELTFVTVTITVTLTSYAFVPAIFTDVGPLALVSPLTLVVRDLQSEAIGLAEFAFSVTPPTLTALTLFGLGAGLYREEDMFTQRAIPLKALDALAGPIRRPWHVGLLSAALLPFVFLAELVAVALLFALGELSIPLVLVFVAVVEELGKSLHVYAAHAHRRFDRGVRTALVLGFFSGLGFFLAEKLAVLAQVVGLPELATGRAALTTGLVSGPFLLVLFLAPLALHVVTASISAGGAARGKRAYVLALVVSVVVHLAYNLAVFEVMGGV